MEVSRDFGGVFRGKSVLVTGHTGFKGSWLSLWLTELGARVSGFALAPEGDDPLYRRLGLDSLVESRLGDVRDASLVQKSVSEIKPDIIFHLAAQSLVRRSYREPRETFEINVLGTVNVLEAARKTPSVRVCQVVTSDKCYRNEGAGVPFKETDPLGGGDPYSASKACAELAAAAYAGSFGQGRLCVSTARAGNVIGGGDWAEDRIVPDCVRALSRGRPVQVRNPSSVRPWQFVLESLSGYLCLAARQWEEPARFAGAWNFGPDPGKAHPVRDVVERIIKSWGGGKWERAGSDGEPLEAPALRLDPSKAAEALGWKAVYGLDESLSETVRWYKASLETGFPAPDFSRRQIGDYAAAARRAGLPWASEARAASSV